MTMKLNGKIGGEDVEKLRVLFRKRRNALARLKYWCSGARRTSAHARKKQELCDSELRNLAVQIFEIQVGGKWNK